MKKQKGRPTIEDVKARLEKDGRFKQGRSEYDDFQNKMTGTGITKTRLTNAGFARIYRLCQSEEEMSLRTGYKTRTINNRYYQARKAGYSLKRLPRKNPNRVEPKGMRKTIDDDQQD